MTCNNVLVIAALAALVLTSSFADASSTNHRPVKTSRKLLWKDTGSGVQLLRHPSQPYGASSETLLSAGAYHPLRHSSSSSKLMPDYETMQVINSSAEVDDDGSSDSNNSNEGDATRTATKIGVRSVQLASLATQGSKMAEKALMMQDKPRRHLLVVQQDSLKASGSSSISTIPSVGLEHGLDQQQQQQQQEASSVAVGRVLLSAASYSSGHFAHTRGQHSTHDSHGYTYGGVSSSAAADNAMAEADTEAAIDAAVSSGTGKLEDNNE